MGTQYLNMEEKILKPLYQGGYCPADRDLRHAYEAVIGLPDMHYLYNYSALRLATM